MSRKFRTYTQILSVPFYGISSIFIVDMCFHIINFTNFAWLGFLILGITFIGGIFIAGGLVMSAINFFRVKSYANKNFVELPWYLYWGIDPFELETKVSDQHKLLTESSLVEYNSITTSEDVKYTIQTWNQTK